MVINNVAVEFFDLITMSAFMKQFLFLGFYVMRLLFSMLRPAGAKALWRKIFFMQQALQYTPAFLDHWKTHNRPYDHVS